MDYVTEIAKLARVRRTDATGWGVIALLFALGLAVRLLFRAQLDPTPFITFIPALPVAALLCGWRKACILLAASIAAVWFVSITDPQGSVLTPSFGLRAAVVAGLGAFLIGLTEALAQTVERMDAAARVNADLFRELQHRVANNFQIVGATLQKARRNVTDKRSGDAIDHAIFRINALGRLHRRLYDPASYELGLEPILREVLAETFSGVPVETRMEIRPKGLSVGQMTTIVLLVNEAAINSAKHVFMRQLGKEFAVSLTSEREENILTVSDDGPGFATPEESTTPRFGLAVMRGLAAQLGGKLEILTGRGARLRVAFGGRPENGQKDPAGMRGGVESNA